MTEQTTRQIVKNTDGSEGDHYHDNVTDPRGVICCVPTNDYCRHCFADGAFTEPDISMQAMLDRCVGIMDKQGIMGAADARLLLADVLPRLKRWSVPADIRR